MGGRAWRAATSASFGDDTRLAARGETGVGPSRSPGIRRELAPTTRTSEWAYRASHLRAEELDRLMPGQKRALVVDDRPDNLSSLCELLATWGFDTDAADDGSRALLALTRRHQDVVVMDLGLPEGDAVDVIRRIKATDDDIIVIVLSGWHHLEAAARGAGAEGSC